MNYSRLFALIISILLFEQLPAQNKYTLSGYLKDKNNGETLIGATVYVEETGNGVTTNPYGFYSLSLPKGKYKVALSYIGYNKIVKEINLTSNITLNAELEGENVQLESVVINSRKKDENVSKAQMGIAKIDSKRLSSLPVLMGESDIMKAIQLMPGVQTASEGTSGFSVRGGSIDQNLLLLDEAPVYNASHLLGFFSVFNSDAIKDATLYKGDIPASNGGRLSSLLDIRMKDGNMKDYHAQGGIGLIASRLTVEGPIKKDKGSFIVSGRRTYLDLFTKLADFENSLYFYDANIKGNYIINENNRVYISGYIGRDVMKANSDYIMQWGNATITARWNHTFCSKLFSNLTLTYSNYSYHLENKAMVPTLTWKSNLQDASLKYDFSHYLSSSFTLKYGISGTLHYIEPGKINKGSEMAKDANHKRSLENGAYLLAEQKIGEKLSLNYGLRLSTFHNFGPGQEYTINSEYEVTDTVNYARNNFFNNYYGWEPRISANYRLTETSSLKAAYNRTHQYLQMASNSSSGTPLDVWFFSSPYVEPQKSDQYSIGYFRNFKDNSIEFSIEGFYKEMENQIDFKDNADLLLNDQLEAELRFGKAYSYGMEILLRKNTGKFNGWVSYTLSKAKRKFEDLNNGEAYNAPYDHPHNINVVATYKISPRLEATASWVYYSGSPITYPSMRFQVFGSNLPYYNPGTKNKWRLPDYHRLDLSLTLKNKRKPGRKWESDWNFAVYNAYNRYNAYSVYFETDKENRNQIKTYKMVLFPVIPSITYNFKF